MLSWLAWLSTALFDQGPAARLPRSPVDPGQVERNNKLAVFLPGVHWHGCRPGGGSEDLLGQPLLRSPLEPWRTWFAAHDLDWPEPAEGSQFNDIGLMCDAAAAGMGIALVRLKLGAPWLDNGSLIRLLPQTVPSPHAHYLCWRTGAMDRWECNAFAQWLKQAT